MALAPNGTGAFIDLVLGGAPQILDPSSISIAGSTISVTLTEAQMPSQGFAFADYRYNLWPRFAPGGANPGDNTQISDFAPDASTFTASAPATSVRGRGPTHRLRRYPSETPTLNALLSGRSRTPERSPLSTPSP